MDERPEGLKERMDERFDDVDRRFGEVDRRMHERFDDVNRRMDERFNGINERFDGMAKETQLRFEQTDERLSRVDAEMGEIRDGIKELHADNKATLRVMLNGFLTLSGAIVAGCAIAAGANAF